MLRLVFKLALRGMQGFVDSIVGLLDLPLRCPNYSLSSKRGRKMDVQIRRRIPDGPLDAVSHEIVAAVLTDAGSGAGEVLPHLLDQLEGESIGRVTADGGYDTRACYG